MTVQEAELQITNILRDLEATSGDLIESIEMEDIDVTRLHDERRRVLKKVKIRLLRRPAHDWAS